MKRNLLQAILFITILASGILFRYLWQDAGMVWPTQERTYSINR